MWVIPSVEEDNLQWQEYEGEKSLSPHFQVEEISEVDQWEGEKDLIDHHDCLPFF